MLAARERRGTKIVVVDPRRTATGVEADLFLPIAPGTDVALFSGLLAHLAETGALNRGFLEKHTAGFADALGPRPRDRADPCGDGAGDRPLGEGGRRVRRALPH